MVKAFFSLTLITDTYIWEIGYIEIEPRGKHEALEQNSFCSICISVNRLVYHMHITFHEFEELILTFSIFAFLLNNSSS